MKKNGRLVAIALGSVLCASCVGGAFLVAGSTPAAETVRAASDTLGVKYTVASTHSVTVSGDVPNGSSAAYSQTYNNTASQVTSGNSATLTLSNLGGIDVSKITLNMKSNASKGAGSLSYSLNGGETIQIIDGPFNTNWYSKWSTSYVDIVKDIDWRGAQDLVITISATQNSLYIQSYTLEYSLPASYDHISIEGVPEKTEYYVGDSFSTAGLVVNGYLTPEDVNPVDLTSQAIWTIDPEQFTEVGDATEVLVMAKIGELDAIASYTVNVKEPATVEYLEVVGDEDITYYAGEDFNLDGLTVIAHMSDGADVDVTDEVTIDAHEFTMEEAENGEASLSIEYRGTSTNLAVTVDFMPIENVRKGNDGAYFYTEGLVTGKFSHSGGYSIFIEDGEYGIMLYGVKADLSEAVAVGDIIAVGGSKTTYGGLIELQNLDRLDIVSTGNEVEPTVIDNVTSSALTGWDSRYIQVSGLTKNRGSLWNGSRRDTLVVNHSSGTIGFYCSNNAVAEDLEPQLDAFFAKIEKLPFTFTGHVGWYDSNAQLNPTGIEEFSCPDYDAVMAFINAYMQPDVGQSDAGNGKSCLEWYPAAKVALQALTETQRDFFLTSDATAAYAKRYNNWAKAYGEDVTSSLGTIMSSNDTAAIIALVALSSATVAAAGFMIASRRRKAK